MKTILAAALLLCCFGIAAHAKDYKFWASLSGDIDKECSDISLSLHTAVELLIEGFDNDRYRTEAAQLATIYQAVCKD